MNQSSIEKLRKRLDGLENMPTIPAVLVPLLQYLDRPLEQLQVQRVVELISQDKSLAAQCLHMANSPLFGRWQAVDSVRNAVLALGIQRMRDIAVSCSVLTLLPPGEMAVDPKVFWEHALGCALVCRQFALKIGFADPAKAYLAGLLHDIGIVAHLWVLPHEFAATLQQAQTQHIPLHEAEKATLGFNHCDTGRMVADRWHLTSELVAVVGCHHDVQTAQCDQGLVAVVALSDLLCRMKGLGHGFVEDRQINFLEEPAFALLLQACPGLHNFDWARFTLELEAYVEETRRLVAVLYSPSPKPVNH